MKDNRIVKDELLNNKDVEVLAKAIDENYEKYHGKGLEERLKAEREANPNRIEIDGKAFDIRYIKRLKLYRTKAGLSQSKLAELSGVNLRMLQFYEQGTKNINHAHCDTVFKLAKVLNCNMEDLLEK
jgi:DNA-binding XRE family transcriptional regulator